MKDSSILTTLLIIAVLKGLLFSQIIPPWEGRDEAAHFGYVQYMAEHHGLPIMGKARVSKEVTASATGAISKVGGKWMVPPGTKIAPFINHIAQHPPLYYLLCLPLYLASRPLDLLVQVRIVRLLSVLLGACVILLAFITTKELFPDNSFLLIGTPSLILLNPQYSYMSGTINNDILLYALFSAFLYYLVTVAKTSSITQRQVFILGTILGLGFLTKGFFIASIPALLLTFYYLYVQKKVQPLRLLKFLVLVFAIALFLNSGWLIRNLMLFKSPFPPPLYMNRVIHSLGALMFSSPFLKNLFVTYWCSICNSNFIRLATTIYILLASFCLLGAIGLIIFCIRAFQGKNNTKNWQMISLIMFVMTIVVLFVLVIRHHLLLGDTEARYMYSALVPINLLLLLGINELTPAKLRGWFLSLIIIGLIAINIEALIKISSVFYA